MRIMSWQIETFTEKNGILKNKPNRNSGVEKSLIK